MRRADRLLAILQALRDGRLRTARWIAASLEVSVRTIYRDIADLQAGGAPIDGERGVAYVLRDGFFLPPLALSLIERDALRWAVAFIGAHGDDALAAAAREVQAKLDAGGAATVLVRASRLTATERAILGTARQATADMRRLRLSYADAAGRTTERVVRPLELEHWGAVWTLTAWCELRQDFRVFRIDRLVACALESGGFRPEPGRTIGDFLALQAPAARPAV